MMKKVTIFAAIAMTMVGCSSDELVNSSTENNEAPIAFSVEKKNISRGTALEELERYNFGVWAYKVKGSESQQVMNNYLVGYSDGAGKGYALNGATTWNANAGTLQDHQSPWFYEKLGKEEYKNDVAANGYLATQSDIMSANDYQYLRYWDLAYTNTNFYAYTPYKASGVKFEEDKKKITVDDGILTAGYSAPVNEFLYAGAQKENKNMEDVELKFYHLGAQVKLRFYEDIPGYNVEIIDVTTSGTGIQATPATYDESTKKYTKSSYYTVCGAEIDYTKSIDKPTATATYGTDATSISGDNLVFAVPSGTIPEAGATSPQKYAMSSTTYYPVPQKAGSKTGFTFHVSYTLKAKDNGETITVHDARVFVPASTTSGSTTTYIAAWQPNTIYTYTFKITTDATGSTNPNDPVIDITNPTVPPTKALYPIVFDGAEVLDYTPSISEKNI
ncbi:fimbrillin family protein [uncultured Prevotella sp.]|uniref:fimbrillin family protein n=1 Tax=uncultured Prevotella sp. TaxID=159272 RepID=UPI0025826A7A|nr:fimbrillin family protein [uncultured Prevotella sp.]